MSDLDKWAFLKHAPADDAKDAELQALTRHLWLASMRRPKVFAELAHALARDAIAYKTDTARVGHEDIAGFTRRRATALDALKRGVDDCDAKARLFVALCLAAQRHCAAEIDARMVPIWNGPQLQHVFAEVCLGGTWLPVETILARARLGEPASQVPAERTTGKWKYT